MEINYILIGKRIKEIRIAKMLTQAELAERADLCVSYICYIETAMREASLSALLRIANVLGVTIDVLLYGNYKIDLAEYHFEVAQLLSDCTAYERRIIYETLCAVKKIVRENWWLRKESEK